MKGKKEYFKKESSSKDVDQKWYIEFSKMESLTSVTTALDWKKQKPDWSE